MELSTHTAPSLPCPAYPTRGDSSSQCYVSVRFDVTLCCVVVTLNVVPPPECIIVVHDPYDLWSMSHFPCTLIHKVLVHDPCSMFYFTCSMDHAPCSMSHVPWLTVHVPWYMVYDPWSMFHGPCSMVRVPCSMLHGVWYM
jgi:hypothetical protein